MSQLNFFRFEQCIEKIEDIKRYPPTIDLSEDIANLFNRKRTVQFNIRNLIPIEEIAKICTEFIPIFEIIFCSHLRFFITFEGCFLCFFIPKFVVVPKPVTKRPSTFSNDGKRK